jgi:hypothetical protein
MGRCVRCGQDAWPNFKICPTCRDKWTKLRDQTFAQAVSEIGPVNAENLKAIQHRVRQLERAAAKETP